MPSWKWSENWRSKLASSRKVRFIFLLCFFYWRLLRAEPFFFFVDSSERWGESYFVYVPTVLEGVELSSENSNSFAVIGRLGLTVGTKNSA